MQIRPSPTNGMCSRLRILIRANLYFINDKRACIVCARSLSIAQDNNDSFGVPNSLCLLYRVQHQLNVVARTRYPFVHCIGRTDARALARKLLFNSFDSCIFQFSAVDGRSAVWHHECKTCESTIALVYCDRLIRIAYFTFNTPRTLRNRWRWQHNERDKDKRMEVKNEVERGSYKTNTEYCIYAMKTLVYELSNWSASAWGGRSGTIVSLLLSDDFIIFYFSCFCVFDCEGRQK